MASGDAPSAGPATIPATLMLLAASCCRATRALLGTSPSTSIVSQPMPLNPHTPQPTNENEVSQRTAQNLPAAQTAPLSYEVPFQIRGLPIVSQFVPRDAQMAKLEQALLQQADVAKGLLCSMALEALGRRSWLSTMPATTKLTIQPSSGLMGRPAPPLSKVSQE